MTPVRHTIKHTIALMTLLLQLSCSTQRIKTIDLHMMNRLPEAVIADIQQIATSLNYQPGVITPENGVPVLLHDKGAIFQFYFQNDEFGTSIVVEVPKNEAIAKIKFGEFGKYGVREFSQKGMEQYHLLVELLASSFGKESVVPHVLNPEPPGSKILPGHKGG